MTRRSERWLRGLPGLLAWCMLGGLAVISVVSPDIVAYVLLLYALYWVFRTCIHLVRLCLGFFYVTKAMQVDWWQRCEMLMTRLPERKREVKTELADWWESRGINPFGQDLFTGIRKAVSLIFCFIRDQTAFRQYVNLREEYRALVIYDLDSRRPACERIEHLVIVPVYKESEAVLGPTLDHLAGVDFPHERVHVLIAQEAADSNADAMQQWITQTYAHSLPHLYFSRHVLMPGEVAGKSANQAYAIQWFEQTVLQQQPIDARHLLVTSLDADYRMHPQYFAHLTYSYVSDWRRDYHIYQPIPMFFNNIWRVNMFSRIQAALGTQIQMARQFDRRENRSWSSYAASFATIKQAGYWDVDVLQEDSRLYWKIYFALGEKVRVQPLFLPVYGDAVSAASYGKALRNLYEQIRRWAWGATDVPYVLVQSIRHREIPLRSRLVACVDVLTNYFNWATMPIILGIGTFLPLYLSPHFAQTVMGYNLPVFTSRLLTFTSVVTVVFVTFDAILSPKKPADWTPLQRAQVYVQWLMMPVVGVLFGALPALDAQTRMLLGKNLDYKVTEKGV
ncbi:MAG TPA: glycosyltransferase family 2 protein [bacterium]|nr:glycosyltransferase family 2 protein [bacterium]